MSNRESSVFRLGNTAIITGGASGIGLALATRCKSSGMNVIICDINTSSPGTAEDILTKTEGNGKIAFSKVDVSNPSDYDSVKRLIEDEFDGNLPIFQSHRR
jgi:NAD(P)-dependent dehydrogenase (short-subunit alcohol dehydrogenase family)